MSRREVAKPARTSHSQHAVLDGAQPVCPHTRTRWLAVAMAITCSTSLLPACACGLPEAAQGAEGAEPERAYRQPSTPPSRKRPPAATKDSSRTDKNDEPAETKPRSTMTTISGGPEWEKACAVLQDHLRELSGDSPETLTSCKPVEYDGVRVPYFVFARTTSRKRWAVIHDDKVVQPDRAGFLAWASAIDLAGSDTTGYHIHDLLQVFELMPSDFRGSPIPDAKWGEPTLWLKTRYQRHGKDVLTWKQKDDTATLTIYRNIHPKTPRMGGRKGGAKSGGAQLPEEHRLVVELSPGKLAMNHQTLDGRKWRDVR